MAQFVIDLLKQKFPDTVISTSNSYGDETIIVKPNDIVKVCTFLRDDPQLLFAMLTDITAVDTLKLDAHIEKHATGSISANHMEPRFRQQHLAQSIKNTQENIETSRFHVVYHLFSLHYNIRIRLKVILPHDNPAVPSVRSIWKGANWPEREVWDMFGIIFEQHGDLRRILMYEEFEGHPLRKDYQREDTQPLVELNEVEDEFPLQSSPPANLVTPPR